MPRREVQAYLESWGFVVYASEKLSELRQAAYENERTEHGSRAKPRGSSDKPGRFTVEMAHPHGPERFYHSLRYSGEPTMARISLDALEQSVTGKRKSRRKTRMRVTSASTVSFEANGERIIFRTTGKRKAAREQKLNEYQLYVQNNIGKYIKDGGGLKQGRAAMKKVAADWKHLQVRRSKRK